MGEENVESLFHWLRAQGSVILLFKCPFSWIQEHNLVWEAHGEHCNMHDRNKQQLSPDTQRQHQIPARIPGCPLSLLGFASCAWQREMRSCWRARHSTSKTLISLGMDEKLCYLCISDDTEGIVIIRGYFRICAPPSKLLYGQTAALLELEGLQLVTPFSAVQNIFSVGFVSTLLAPPVGFYWSVLNASARGAAARFPSRGQREEGLWNCCALLPGPPQPWGPSRRAQPGNAALEAPGWLSTRQQHNTGFVFSRALWPTAVSTDTRAGHQASHCSVRAACRTKHWFVFWSSSGTRHKGSRDSILYSQRYTLEDIHLIFIPKEWQLQKPTAHVPKWLRDRISLSFKLENTLIKGNLCLKLPHNPVHTVFKIGINSILNVSWPWPASCDRSCRTHLLKLFSPFQERPLSKNRCSTFPGDCKLAISQLL